MKISKVALVTRQHLDLLQYAALRSYRYRSKPIYFQPPAKHKWKAVFETVSKPGDAMRVFWSRDKVSAKVTYVGLITKIEEKDKLSKVRKKQVLQYIPPSENGLYGIEDTPPMKNLLEIKYVKKLKNPVKFSTFTKISDRKSLLNSYMRFEYAIVKAPTENWIRKRVIDKFEISQSLYEEGNRYMEERKLIKRNAFLVEEAKYFYEAICEACGNEMKKTYGDVGAGYVQFHHREPLGTYKKPRLNSVKDLAPLCPNCHAMIHRTNPVMSVLDFKKKVLKKKKL